MHDDTREYKDKLNTILEMVTRTLTTDKSISVGTKELLEKIQYIVEDKDIPNSPKPEELSHVILSCDASITQNPGGKAAVGFVIQVPGKTDYLMSTGRPSRSSTINQAEYDAVYEGLVTLFNLHNNPGPLVEVRSDSQLVIRQLNKDWECNDPTLLRKRDAILELITHLPSEIRFVWRPRNSTPELELANYLAQDTIGVPRK